MHAVNYVTDCNGLHYSDVGLGYTGYSCSLLTSAWSDNGRCFTAVCWSAQLPLLDVG
jgi:hypothetical protein